MTDAATAKTLQDEEGRPPTRKIQRVRNLATTLAIAAGGATGAVARYLLTEAIPNAGAFPTATFVTNVAGCFLIGVLMAVVTATKAHRLLRPFVGVGILGGFTTFSIYAVETLQLMNSQPALGVLYLAGTVTTALAATWVGLVVTRKVLGRG